MALGHEFLYYLHNVLNMLLYVIPLLDLLSFCKKNWTVLFWARDVFILLFDKFLIWWLIWMCTFNIHELFYAQKIKSLLCNSTFALGDLICLEKVQFFFCEISSLRLLHLFNLVCWNCSSSYLVSSLCCSSSWRV